jgi:hypothetical protein
LYIINVRRETGLCNASTSADSAAANEPPRLRVAGRRYALMKIFLIVDRLSFNQMICSS